MHFSAVLEHQDTGENETDDTQDASVKNYTDDNGFLSSRDEWPKVLAVVITRHQHQQAHPIKDPYQVHNLRDLKSLVSLVANSKGDS